MYTDSITGLLDSVYTPEDDLMGRVDLFICPNYEDGTMYFNGNDAVTLETSSGDIIDVFGKSEKIPVKHGVMKMILIGQKTKL